MKTFEFTETTWDLVNNQRVKLADWTVATAGNNAIIIQKITPTTKSGDSIKKVVLADEIVYNSTDGTVKDWNLNGEDVTLGVKKN